MFYIQTAVVYNGLRVWRDSMEGGLQLFKDVVVHDSLGVAAELERRMSHVVGTYQDEWRTAVEDPKCVNALSLL